MAGLPLPSNSFVYKRVPGADPAAGSEVTDAVPTGKAWWLLSVTVALVQGLTQTPQPALVIDDGATSIFEAYGSSAAQAASTTVRYCWAPDVQLTGLIGTTPNIRANSLLPQNLILPAGYRIRTATAGIGANTDYGIPSYYVIEFSK
jgi:hypothetical protein